MEHVRFTEKIDERRGTRIERVGGMNINTYRCYVSAIALVLTSTGVSLAQTGERLSDDQVKSIIEEVNNTRDRFEDQLDGKIKSSTLRDARREVSVEDYLNDLQDNVTKLKDRFKKDYSASAEATTVLRQGTSINTFIKTLPGEVKGGSEWDALALQLGKLAAAYGTMFPLPEGAAVRRINDGEAADTGELLAKKADEVKDAISKEPTLAQPDKDSLVADLNQLKEQAETVKSRASDSKPATAEARQVVAIANKLQSFASGHQLSPSTTQALTGVQEPLAVLKQAYGIHP